MELNSLQDPLVEDLRDLLSILNEEGETDEKLTQLAENMVDPQVKQAD